MTEITWSEAPQSIIHAAEELIRQYHPWLNEARIAFVMRSEAQKKGHVLGQASKVPEKMQPYLEYDFLIWLSEKDVAGMANSEIEALIDHELCHCAKNLATDGWKLREHDIQEFAEIISRHGLWSADLRRMDKAVEIYQQGNLLKDTEITMSDGRGRVVSMTGDQLKRASELTGEQIHEVIKNNPADFADELLAEVRQLRDENGQISTSGLQRVLKIGYSRATRIKELMDTAEVAKESAE